MVAQVSDPLFAADIRESEKRRNRNGIPHTSRLLRANIDPALLNNADAFHRVAEELRLAMLDKFLEHGAPINVWRIGELAGDVRVMYAAGEGELGEPVDLCHLTLRTRVSVEHPPFTHEG